MSHPQPIAEPERVRAKARRALTRLRRPPEQSPRQKQITTAISVLHGLVAGTLARALGLNWLAALVLVLAVVALADHGSRLVRRRRSRAAEPPNPFGA